MSFEDVAPELASSTRRRDERGIPRLRQRRPARHLRRQHVERCRPARHSLAAFMPDAPSDVREMYRHHARGNSLFRNRGDGGFEDTSVEAGAHGAMGMVVRHARFDSDGGRTSTSSMAC